MSQTRLGSDHAADRAERRQAELWRAFDSPAFSALAHQAAGVDVQSREPTASLATCEKVPTSANADGPPSGDHGKQGDRSVYKDPPEFVESADDLDHVPDALEALRASISRDRARQRKVTALVQAGEVAHAKRLATCQRQSIQLECPEMAGGCGSDGNYVPVHCDSRLCPACMKRKMGQKVGQYLPRVAKWDHPTMLRLSLPERVDPDELDQAIDALRGAFGRLRRRVVPASGDGWEWRPWKSALCGIGARELARRWQKRYVSQGRGIPMDEILRTGFYGIDIKQKPDGRLNVHLHILADVPYLPQAALSALWDDLTAAPVVDIRRVDGQGTSDRERALMEVIGYAAKAPEYESVDDEVAYFTALKGSKLIQPFGDLHGNTLSTPALLHCCDCGCAPRWWNYQGIVDGHYETATVHGADGDRPPP